MAEPAGKDYLLWALKRERNEAAAAPIQRETAPMPNHAPPAPGDRRKANDDDAESSEKPRKKPRESRARDQPSEDEVVNDLSPYLKVHRSGWVTKLGGSSFTPPSSEGDPTTGVSSKYVKISPNVSARVYLPASFLAVNQPTPPVKLPILVYYHGGGFCRGSALTVDTHNYVNHLAAKANAVVISVEYRLAPNHPIPTAFEDSWEALQWVASHFAKQTPISTIEQGKSTLKSTYRKFHGILPSIISDKAPAPAPASALIDRAEPVEPWLVKYGDFSRLFVGGDGAGGTIAHYVSLQAGDNTGKTKTPLAGGVKILGSILCFPYFVDESTKKESIEHRLWMYVSPGGIDDPLINPFGRHYNPFQFEKMFICYGEKDRLRRVNRKFAKAMMGSDLWKGYVKEVRVKEEDHCFQIRNPKALQAQELIMKIVTFIKG